MILLTSSSFAQKSSGWSLLFSWDRFNAGNYPVATVFSFDGDQIDLGGIGVEYQLASTFTIQAALHFGMTSSEVKQGTVTLENSSTEYGIGVGPVWYPRGYNTTSVRPYMGATLNLGGASSTQEAGENKVELSASSFGFHIFGGADFEIIDGFRVGAGYGIMYASFPASTRKTTVTGGTTTEDEGPSGSAFMDVFHLNCKIIL